MIESEAISLKRHCGNMLEDGKHFEFIHVIGSESNMDMNIEELRMVTLNPNHYIIKRIFWGLLERGGINDILRKYEKRYSYDEARIPILKSMYLILMLSENRHPKYIHILYKILRYLYQIRIAESARINKVYTLENSTVDLHTKDMNYSEARHHRLRFRSIYFNGSIIARKERTYGYMRMYCPYDGLSYVIVEPCESFVDYGLYRGFMDMMKRYSKKELLKLSLFMMRIPIDVLHRISDYFC